jgi:hypothetical protein
VGLSLAGGPFEVLAARPYHACPPGVRRLAQRSPVAERRVTGVGSLPPVVSRPPGDSPPPSRHPYASKLDPWAAMANARRSRARGADAAACGLAGLRPSHDPALGCVGHKSASARPSTDTHTAHHRGGQKCSSWRHSGAYVPAHEGATR